MYTPIFVAVLMCMTIGGCSSSAQRMGDFYIDHEIDPQTGKELGRLRFVALEVKSKDFTGHDVTQTIPLVLNEETGDWYVFPTGQGDSPGMGKSFLEGTGQAAIGGLLQVWAFKNLPGVKINSRIDTAGGNSQGSTASTGTVSTGAVTATGGGASGGTASATGGTGNGGSGGTGNGGTGNGGSGGTGNGGQGGTGGGIEKDAIHVTASPTANAQQGQSANSGSSSNSQSKSEAEARAQSTAKSNAEVRQQNRGMHRND